MATLAQPALPQAKIREVLADVPVPLGVSLHSLELRENHHGDPSLFVTYAVTSTDRTDAEQAKLLARLANATLAVLYDLDMTLFCYVDFQAV